MVVTGAAREIGRGIAQKFAAEGATVAVTDVDEVTAKATAGAIGGHAFAVRLDVTSRESVAAAVEAVLGRCGRIDVLVNNAGWDRSARFVDSDPAGWDKVLAISLLGTLNTTQAVLPVMVGQGSGSVLNIASDAGRVGSSTEAVYSAAKGGVIAFTKTIAREMARHGVNANCVCPGPADTDLFAEVTAGNEKLRDALRPGDPAAAARAAVRRREHGRLPRLAGGLVRDGADRQRQRRADHGVAQHPRRWLNTLRGGNPLGHAET